MTTNDRSREDFTDIFGSLHSLLLSAPGVEDFLARLADLAAIVVEPPASCGITTRYDGKPLTIATSDERAALVDEYQYGSGQGPCLESLRTGELVEVTDQLTDKRWAGYRVKAVELGVRCSLSLPLTADDLIVGAMNVYGYDRADTFDETDKQRLTLFAAQASTALALAIRAAQQTELAEQLEQALSSRTVIDQAIGLLMGQQRCDAQTAFALLRKHSQHNNLKLRDVAVDLITRVSGYPPVPAEPFGRSGSDDPSLHDGAPSRHGAHREGRARSS